MFDPLSDVLNVIGAKVTRRTRMEASGQWALAFPAVDRLKFVALLRGRQWVIVPGDAPRLMEEGDVCLIGRTPYVVASDPDITPVDGLAFYGDPGCDVARIGGDDTIGVGGTVTVGAGNGDFLLEMLPDFMIVSRSSAGSEAIAKVLSLMNDEIGRDMIGSEIINARLADVLLVEAIRTYAGRTGPLAMGWLGALADDRLGRALRAMHEDITQQWTVARLASVAGMSRAAFSAAFARNVGKPPLAYLRMWRLTVAYMALMRGDVTVASVALEVGYTSQSAFGYAFRRAFGHSPKALV
tara:strand:- start:1103 stop:1993 length:891 start_codon:yes stop_codon:yes gene_type:complete